MTQMNCTSNLLNNSFFPVRSGTCKSSVSVDEPNQTLDQIANKISNAGSENARGGNTQHPSGHFQACLKLKRRTAESELTKESIQKTFSPGLGLCVKANGLVDARSIVGSVTGFNKHNKFTGRLPVPVRSLIVTVLCDLHKADKGVTHVVCAPTGQGKTFGA